LGAYNEVNELAKGKATKGQIEDFLNEFRACSRPRVEIEPRPENLTFLSSLDHFSEDADKIILEEINYKHYHKGPRKERDEKHEPGEIWIFKINKFDTEIYIKLKLYRNRINQLSGKCISFHP